MSNVTPSTSSRWTVIPGTLTRTATASTFVGAVTYVNFRDGDDNPSGGTVQGEAIDIRFQNGPVSLDGPNGVQIEDVLYAALQRLEFVNQGKFRCRENSLAITKIQEALFWLRERTERRQRAGVEGTHQTTPDEG